MASHLKVTSRPYDVDISVGMTVSDGGPIVMHRVYGGCGSVMNIIKRCYM